MLNVKQLFYVFSLKPILFIESASDPLLNFKIH
jgi:hypothetical protein